MNFTEQVCGFDRPAIKPLVIFDLQVTIPHVAGAVESSARLRMWMPRNEHPMDDTPLRLANLKMEFIVTTVIVSSVTRCAVGL